MQHQEETLRKWL